MNEDLFIPVIRIEGGEIVMYLGDKIISDTIKIVLVIQFYRKDDGKSLMEWIVKPMIIPSLEALEKSLRMVVTTIYQSYLLPLIGDKIPKNMVGYRYKIITDFGEFFKGEEEGPTLEL